MPAGSTRRASHEGQRRARSSPGGVIACRFDTPATADAAVDSLVEAVAAVKPDCPGLTIQCDNGSQYAGKKFQKAASGLDIRPKFTWKSTPPAERPHRIVPLHPRVLVHLAARPCQTTSRPGRPYQKRSVTATRTGCTRRPSTSRPTSSRHRGKRRTDKAPESVKTYRRQSQNSRFREHCVQHGSKNKY